MVSVANGSYVGAAYAIAPEARIEGGLLELVVFRGVSVVRVLLTWPSSPGNGPARYRRRRGS
jgi:YegS C-terminal NAD kinase beta sandwich-like domain